MIIELKLYMKRLWMVHYKGGYFMWVEIPRWPPPQDVLFNKVYYMYWKNKDTLNMIKLNLYMRGHWMIP